MECFCDYEPAEFYHVTRPIARKQYGCDECEHTIQPGERYERVFGVWEGAPNTFKTCFYCLSIRDMCEQRLDCLCWAHGNMREDIRVDLDYRTPDPPGLRMAIGRIIVEQRHAN